MLTWHKQQKSRLSLFTFVGKRRFSPPSSQFNRTIESLLCIRQRQDNLSTSWMWLLYVFFSTEWHVWSGITGAQCCVERGHPSERLRLTGGNHTKMGFNGPSIERLSKANLWPSALTPANPSHPPGSSVCHWSFVKPLCTDLITAQFGSADYTLLGSGQASFSNFTWQQIAGLLREE